MMIKLNFSQRQILSLAATSDIIQLYLKEYNTEIGKVFLSVETIFIPAQIINSNFFLNLWTDNSKQRLIYFCSDLSEMFSQLETRVSDFIQETIQERKKNND